MKKETSKMTIRRLVTTVGGACVPTRTRGANVGRKRNQLRNMSAIVLHAKGGGSFRGTRLLLVVYPVGGILLVLVLRDEISDVLVGLLEFHLVHALALVPVKERLALVHRAELSGEPLEDTLQRCGISYESARILVVLGRRLNNASFLIVRDPLDEVVGVSGLALLDHLINLLGGHLA